ncbi:MAG: hypothetical protein CMJ25_13550 [Phycisphaerae bacterium]|nr:hypothetical protein [Phycisphaerae bacterium]
MSTGWIKLHRQLLGWEWYSDVNTTRVFLHLLLVANHKDNNWRGIEIKRGQRLTSINALANETNLSIKNIRTSIKRLKSTNEVASHSTAQHTVFTMVNYDLYQDVANEVANEGQAKGKQRATNKNDNNDKNDKNKERSSLINDGFEHWWKDYPKKADKKNSFTKFKVATKKLDDEGVTDFVNLITRDCKKRFVNTQKEFVPLPTTYLNGERWNDEIIGGR